MATRHEDRDLPYTPLDAFLSPVWKLMHAESAGGIVLLACTLVALAIANSALGHGYHDFWLTPLGLRFGSFEIRYSLEHWVNDGLMTVFFFVVGLEVKREIVHGHLRDLRSAALPLVAAIGGMVVPAAFYLAMRGGTPDARGWGVPMATDIAFVVGCMAVLGQRCVPNSLRVMLLSLAIADDIGAILVIALGYSSGVSFLPLGIGLALIGGVMVCERIGVRSYGIYALLAILVWFAFLQSGVHATIAGVLLGLVTPTEPYVVESAFGGALDRIRGVLHSGEWSRIGARAGTVSSLRRVTQLTVSPVEYLEALLHPWVAFFIMPLFALVNAAVPFNSADALHPVACAVAFSLLVGKPVGILLFSWLGILLGLARKPEDVSWAQLAGGGILCGIGFTMALFIASLALADAALASAKVGILAGSALAAIGGTVMLRRAAPTVEP